MEEETRREATLPLEWSDLLLPVQIGSEITCPNEVREI